MTDAEELRAASGCLGLLGIVVSLVLQLDTMCVAEMRPFTCPLLLTIPPPDGYRLPAELQAAWAATPQAARDEAKRNFISRCENDYYLEWFWFPYQEDAWVNTWASECRAISRPSSRPPVLTVDLYRTTDHASRFGPQSVPGR